MFPKDALRVSIGLAKKGVKGSSGRGKRKGMWNRSGLSFGGILSLVF